MKIELTQEQFETLKSILIWAEFYDRERNNYKNKEVIKKFLIKSDLYLI